MIGRADIDARVGEWGLREDIVEKDYILGWVLWGIGTDPVLGERWIFKGGTCLKKCYIETYRFSEDLDFTVVEGGPLVPDDVLAALDRVLARVGEQSGIDFAVRAPSLRPLQSGRAAQGRVYYRGPRSTPTPASIKLDLSGDEVVVRPAVLRPISHPYPEAFPSEAVVRCYGFEEVFAEKLRAMGERGRPRDLYDIVNLFRRPDLRRHPDVIREVLAEKCRAKGVAIPTLDTVANSPFRAELESEWSNMLSHQLPALPPVGQFLDELPNLFAWLDQEAMPPVLEPIAAAADEQIDWSPPPTAATWGAGVPLETVRFAAANHLCVELGYQGSVRLIEPYSLRRTRDGNLILHAIRVDNRAHRGYRVDHIQSVRVTNTPFAPVYAIEFTPSGALAGGAAAVARPSSVRSRARRSRPFRAPGIVYVIECPLCQKRFRHKTNDTRLRSHKAPAGRDCHGRQGWLADIEHP